MGSAILYSQSILLAVCFGILFLLFDAARYFAHHLNPVRLRRWSGADPQFEKASRWFQYSPLHFSLITGALLQVALAASVGFTVIAFSERGLMTAGVMASVLWALIAVVWKVILALLPDSVAEFSLRTIIPISYLFYYLFWPFLFPLRMLLSRRTRQEEQTSEDEEVTDEEVQAYIDVGEQEGILEEGEGKLVQSIVDFGDRVAKELMTPRIDVVAFDAGSPVDELARLFSESKYSRIPIFEQSIDKIVGIVHIKDLFEAHLHGGSKSPRELARPPLFVPETKNVADLLRDFQLAHIQIAIVVDEYGGTSGLITIEDVLEEIVGDLSDEHEDSEESVIEVENGVYLVNGLTRVETLEDFIKRQLGGDGYETVAGLIFTQMGRVPKVGEIVRKDDVVFQVDRADRKRIFRVRVSVEPPDSQVAEE